MAGVDLSKEDEWSQIRRTSAPFSCQPKENMIWLQDRPDRNWFRGFSDEKDKSLIGSKRHNKSGISEDLGRINTGAAASATWSSIGNPPEFEVRAVSIDSSLRMSDDNIDKNNTTLLKPSTRVGTGLSPPDLERPLSPRSQIRTFQGESSRSLLSNHSGPLDQVLLQEVHLAGLADDAGKVKEEGKRLRSLRTNALRLRAQLRIKRKELQEKQAAKTSSDEAFIKFVRENRSTCPASNAQNLSEGVPEAYYTAMQIARDEYGPLEDEYSLIEDILDKTEFEMAKIETRLYGLESPYQGDDYSMQLALPQLDDSLAPGLASNSLLGLSTEVPDQYEPVHAEYLSRLGDLDLARERYHNTIQEHESLLLEQESRSRVGMELDANLQAFLANLPAGEASLRGEITQIEIDVERLREECLEAGIDLDESNNGSESANNTETEVNRPNLSLKMTPGLQEVEEV